MSVQGATTMANTEGTGPTDLFNGWSSVVHQPCEDPPESELPSTVDMAAFSGGLNVEPTDTTNAERLSDTESDSDSSNTGSDPGASSSPSDSSDSETSTSGEESTSRSPSPQFSITTSQPDGLRLTIATVKKDAGNSEDENDIKRPIEGGNKSATKTCCSSSDSRSTSDTGSDTETSNRSKVSSSCRKIGGKSAKDCSSSSSNGRKILSRTRLRVQEKRDNETRKSVVNNKKEQQTIKTNLRSKGRPKRGKKMASLPLSRGSTYNSSDSDDADSAMLASCSLQEIRQEDLAAILPDQQECDAFDDFECSRTGKSSPQAGDLSGSDIELPQQAVNALIQRTTESSSECESHAPPNPNTLYANSLLQQFVAQTQMLNAPCPVMPQGGSNGGGGACGQTTSGNTDAPAGGNGGTDMDVVKRKRGRPKKSDSHKINRIENKSQNKCLGAEYCGDPNVSPDSGIQNSPDHVSSPEPCPTAASVKSRTKDDRKKCNSEVKSRNDSKCDNNRNNSKVTNQSKGLSKLSVTSNRFDRLLYGNTDRVLYPPRRKVGRPPITKKGPGRPPKHKTTESVDSKNTTEKNGEKSNKTTKTKQDNRTTIQSKGKLDDVKIKYTTLKNMKVMHSKHKHRKHKKYKFKILKPVGESLMNDPKINAEIEKLVNDFMKFCVIGVVKPPKETVGEVLKTAKKVSKKRKTAEYVERKKKKLSTNATVNKDTNLNEQRLPLKKRHYLFSDGKCPNAKQNKSEELSPKEEKDSSASNSSMTTPKKRHRLEMDVTSLKSHNSPTASDHFKNKPKLSLESLICELKMKRSLSLKNNANNSLDQKKNDSIKDDMQKAQLSNQDTNKSLAEPLKKKIRKRRAINRTGFPTIKKKKKKILTNLESNSVNSELDKDDEDKEDPELSLNECDRVPKDGEECDKFIERTEGSDDPDTEIFSKAEDSMFKWDMMSECDSLPQDERIELEKSDTGEFDENLLDTNTDRSKSRLDKKKRKRSSEKMPDINGFSRRKLRDVSPASSIEPLTERRLRDDRSASGDEIKRGKKAPRWRKRYLIAGLFSDYYKEDDETIRLKRTENAVKSRIIYVPSEHPYGLLPRPYHCGKYFRSHEVPFQLPYDLWWQHTHSQLPGRDVVPSWNYRKIRTNVYNVKTTVGACEPQPCNCTSDCGDDCINRLVLAECPASHRCQNQKIQRHEWSPGLEKFMTESKGWGVRTKLPIKTGEFILEYVGEVVADQEFKERMATIYVNDIHHYCLHLDGGLVIDGHRMGGDGRFVNHSCQPNCEMQKWSVNGQFRMALFALREIEANEELTYDYNFSLFNPAEGQECKCGSDMCRGVIGGKSQRVRQLPQPAEMAYSNGNKQQNGRVGRPRKNQARKASANTKDIPLQTPLPIIPPPQVKPMSHQQKCFILERHCFLLRNLSKVRKVRDRSASSLSSNRQQNGSPVNQGATFMNHLNALEKPRNIRTRRLAQAEDDPELSKSVKIAAVLRDIWTAVTKAKDENNEPLCTVFMTLPSKRKSPEFYQTITNPIDLTTIEQNIATGVYRTPESFNTDMNRLFTSFIRFYGHASEMGIAATKLKKIYLDAKQASLPKFESVLGKKPSPNFVSNKNKNEEEDIIRCICGMHHDEGLMIQCERCLVWQHCECVKADASAPSYHCEQCVPREVDYEIPLEEFTEHGHRYYLTLLRGKLQLRQGDTVYVLRDIPIPGTDKKHTYDTIGKIEYTDLDIFRIERLWKDSKTGQRFAYGHHYLRPHETYHEPTRKFFPNEVMRVPLYEAVPVELIISHCWVMDLNTYCKGRPIGAPEEHIYICEYRVDKNARLFSKVSKSKYPICTKSFAFERFEMRLKISRTYTPHDLDPAMVKPRGRKPQETEENKEIITPMPIHVPVIRTPVEQKARLNKILLNLLSKMPTKQIVDVSYLLEGGRRRKKQENNK